MFIRHPEAAAKRLRLAPEDDEVGQFSRQQEIEEKRSFFTGGSDRIAVGIEAILLGGFLGQRTVGGRTA